MKTELYNKIVLRRKQVLKDYVTVEELNRLLFKILEEQNIKFKNEESKKISETNLFALKLSKVNEDKIRKIFYAEVKKSINIDIPDIDNILDSILIKYKCINNINYLYINF